MHGMLTNLNNLIWRPHFSLPQLNAARSYIGHTDFAKLAEYLGQKMKSVYYLWLVLRSEGNFLITQF